ncbi:protein SPEAR4 isoform X1 [Dioscorea cayenensis subsp. rotundata]|uniref:Protein SPEAR4 isoform X1 n=1 Tax=Dioscorea cayennensis subsp. rotundata TaxID=55577 RepID=A0AB40BEY5_DIOCR|nr:protein SPEAR4 isoform X1 [Dioscorea cayenensis subsp. rotundata]
MVFLDGIVAFEGKSSMVLQERVVSKGKNKPKRPPQRGLGVAQLEKLRLQEQQKNLSLTSSAVLDPNPMFRSSVNQNQPNSWERSSLSVSSHKILQQQQHDLSNALLVSKSLTPSSSSGVHLQMEPPSNQSYCSNYSTVISSWPEEDTNLVEMVGMKRSCPFQLENLHSSYPCKVPSFLTTLREGSSISICKKENSVSDGGFLSLGPSLAPSVPKSKQFMAFSTTKHSQTSDLNFPLYHKNAAVAAADDDNDTFKLSFGNSGQAPPYYAFFPVRTNTQEAMLNEQRGEVFDGIDLNLKL